MESPPEEDLMPPSPSSSSSSSSSVSSPFRPPFQPPRKVPRRNLSSPHPQVGLLSPSQTRDDNNKQIQEVNSITPSSERKTPFSSQFRPRLYNASNSSGPSQDKEPQLFAPRTLPPSQRRDLEQGNSSDRSKQIEEVKSLGPSSENKPLTSSDQFTMPGILCHGENVKPPDPAQIRSRIKSTLGNAPDDSRPLQDTKPANILRGSSHDNTNIGGPSANFTTSSHPVPSNHAANFSMNQAAVNSVNHHSVSQDIIRSCNCRISKCAAKYCRCVRAKVACSTLCECEDCQNSFGRRPPYGRRI